MILIQQQEHQPEDTTDAEMMALSFEVKQEQQPELQQPVSVPVEQIEQQPVSVPVEQIEQQPVSVPVKQEQVEQQPELQQQPVSVPVQVKQEQVEQQQPELQQQPTDTAVVSVPIVLNITVVVDGVTRTATATVTAV